METKTITLVKREAVFMKRSELGRALTEKLVGKYAFYFYEEKACAQCEFRNEKESMPPGQVSDLCENCAAFKGGHQLAVKVKVGENNYLRTPIGDMKNLIAYLEGKGYIVKIRDKNPNRPVKTYKFTGTLKDHQRECVDAIKEDERGIIKAPPRSGKTVLATAFACEIGKKTIIIASQRDWLVGFLETFVGSKTQIPLTNIDKSRIGFARKLEDFKKFDVCLCTVQTFYSEIGVKLLEKIRDMFSVAIYDECQTSAAPKYAMIASKLNVQYALALSGTPKRKDMKHVITENIIGPQVHSVTVEQLKPSVRLIRTDYSKSYPAGTPWVRMVSALEKDKKRMKLIATWALKDMEAGHLVLIPFTQVKPILLCIDMINKLAGKRVAYPFYGAVPKARRDATIQRAREYRIKIIVGNTKLLSVGINIPRASCLYDTTMSSNKYNAEQRVCRILTPWDDKPTPLLRIFLDNMNVRRRCLANEWWQCIHPKFRPTMAARDEISLKAYLSQGSRPAGFSGHEL